LPDEEPTLPPPPPPPSPGDTWAGATAPPAPTVDAGQLRGLRSLSIAAMALVAVVAVLNLVSIPNDLAYMSNIQDFIDGELVDTAEIEDQEDMRGMYGALIILSLLASATVWVVWQQKARAVAKGLGAGGQRHSEPLAAFSWIIPIGNLWLPKQVTNDLWRASDPEAPAPTNIAGKPVWPLIDLWWALWIIGAVIGRLAFNAEEPDTVAELDSYLSDLRIELGTTIVTLAASVLAVLILHRITLRLTERAQRMGTTV
jgi:eukaryotic-like serine/threonine-protein kinase